MIEAARFDATIRAENRAALALFSASSYRFERPIDPAATEWASRRCAELILETAGGTLHPGLIDVGRAPRRAVRSRFALIRFRASWAWKSAVTRSRILKALGLEERGATSNALTVIPPTWRSDLEREIDLIEEVARVHGYEHIPEDRAVPLTSAPRGIRERVEGQIRGALTGLGFDEAVTFSLVADELATPFALGATTAPIRVEHSSRKRESALRQSLVPSLLAVRRHNEAHGNPDAELFEIADVYLPRSDQELPDQPTRLALVGGRDFLAIKGVVETLLARLHVAGKLEARPGDVASLAAGRAAELLLDGEHLGYLGEVSRPTLDALELRGACAAAELELGVLVRRTVLVPQNRAIPPFPAVDRDLSLVVDRSLPWAELSAAVTAAAGSLLEGIDYLDTFAGGNLPDDRHSVHFGLRFRHAERTLTGEEVDRSVQAVVAACGSRFAAVLR